MTDSVVGRIRETVWKFKDGRDERESWNGTKRTDGRLAVSFRERPGRAVSGEEVGTDVDIDALDVPWSVAARAISTAAGAGAEGVVIGVDPPGTEPILEVV